MPAAAASRSPLSAPRPRGRQGRLPAVGASFTGATTITTSYRGIELTVVHHIGEVVGTVPVSNRRIDKATASTDHQLPMRRAADDAASKRCRIDIRRRGEQHARDRLVLAPASDWSPSVGASFTALATKVVRGQSSQRRRSTLERDAVRAIPVRSWCVEVQVPSTFCVKLPCCGMAVTAAVSASPSTSLAPANRSTVVLPSSSSVTVRLGATGTSFTGVTVSTTVAGWNRRDHPRAYK